MQRHYTHGPAAVHYNTQLYCTRQILLSLVWSYRPNVHAAACPTHIRLQLCVVCDSSCYPIACAILQDRIIPCKHDPTLPTPPSTKRYVVATNLHNSAGIMPNFIVQLLKLLIDLPAEAAYVSAYESGSTDATPMWLILLRMLLACISVPHTITVSGAWVRQPGQERIEHLALVRNELLAPFFVHEGSNSSKSGGFLPDQVRAGVSCNLAGAMDPWV